MAIFEGRSQTELRSHLEYWQDELADIEREGDTWGTRRMLAEQCIEEIEAELAKEQRDGD